MKTLLIVLYGFIHYWLDPLVRLFASRAPQANRKRVLVLRVDAVGDFVLWLDAAKELRRIYPPEMFEIVLAVNKNAEGLARPLPYWDKIIGLDMHPFFWNISYRWSLLRQIKSLGFDIALNPHMSHIMFGADSLIRSSGARERIGCALYDELNDPFFLKIKQALIKPWYTKLIPIEHRPPMMELQLNAKFLRGLGIEDMKPAMPRLIIEDQGKLQDLKKDYFVIVPQAGWDGKAWPLVHFKDIARRVGQMTGWQPVWLGVKDGIELGPTAPGALDLIGKTSVMQYAGVIAGSKCVIANDSSAVHMAAALKVTSFCIAGGGHWGRFIPYPSEIESPFKPRVIHMDMPCYGCRWTCIYPREQGTPYKCIADISMDLVWKDIENYLKR